MVFVLIVATHNYVTNESQVYTTCSDPSMYLSPNWENAFFPIYFGIFPMLFLCNRFDNNSQLV